MNLKERLHSHLIQIVRDRNPYLASQGHFYAQQYIREQLAQWGTVEIDDFSVRGPSVPPKLRGGSKKNHPKLRGGSKTIWVLKSGLRSGCRRS
jgi:hypothetical protein